MKQRDLTIIAIFTFITVVAWIGLTLYHTNVTTTISGALQKKIEPIPSQFDTATIEMLKKDRIKLDVLTEIVASAAPTLVIPQQSGTQSATAGGSL